MASVCLSESSGHGLRALIVVKEAWLLNVSLRKGGVYSVLQS